MKNLFDFTKETITINTTVYAKWSVNNFIFVFNSKGGTGVDQQTIKRGEKAKKPNDPTRDDYLFEGWYKEEALTTLFDFDREIITANITLYAKWKKIGKLTFSITPVASSVQLGMSSNLKITNIGAVIRLATEVAPTKEQAKTSAGYISLNIDVDSTREFSISQHYLTNFDDGFTLADVLAPNTKYILYLFTPSVVDLRETEIKGGQVKGDRIEIPFMTTTLPPAGDIVWNEKWIAREYVASLNEYHFMESQTGIIVTYFQTVNSIFIQEVSSRDSEDTTTYETRGSYSPSSGAKPRANIYYNYGGITGYTSDYGYFIISEKQSILKIRFQSTYTDTNGNSTSFLSPIFRY